MARILVPLPDSDFDTTEVSVPWHLLRAEGHELVFATETGARPACDRRLLDGVIFGQLGADETAKQLYAVLERDAAFLAPITWSSIMPGEYDALLLAGGHAPGMRQYLGSSLLQERIAAFWALERPVGAICHGVLVLARAKDPRTGRSVLADVRTTCLPKYMERTAYFLTSWRLGSYYRTYPAYVEDEVRAALTDAQQFERGPRVLTARGTQADDGPAFIVDDGRYVSARWPGDAWLFGKALAAKLR